MAERPRLLPRSFYSAPPEMTARALLGKLLVRPATPSTLEEKLVGRIVEVEAYFGGEDPAAHAFVGKTARNAVLFGPPGHAYVYFIYGMYSCLNVSCGPEGEAGGVLIRALEPLAGLKTMARRRWPGAESASRHARSAFELTSGPGRLCQAFGITRATDNNADYTSPRSRLQIQDDGFVAGDVIVTPRVGIRKAADRLARFVVAGNPHVSRLPGFTAAIRG
jgi:DNA-3-methyladenine glycosylase